MGALDIAPTSLGAIEKPDAEIYGVIYEVDAKELEATDRREAKPGNYLAAELDLDRVTVLKNGMTLPANSMVRWYPMNRTTVNLPSAQFPICQSYVDIFITGALEVQTLSSIKDFAVQAVATTAGWVGQDSRVHWVNDRVMPYRPFANLRSASSIHKILWNATTANGTHLDRYMIKSVQFPAVVAYPQPDPLLGSVFRAFDASGTPALGQPAGPGIGAWGSALACLMAMAGIGALTMPCRCRSGLGGGSDTVQQRLDFMHFNEMSPLSP